MGLWGRPLWRGLGLEEAGRSRSHAKAEQALPARSDHRHGARVAMETVLYIASESEPALKPRLLKKALDAEFGLSAAS